MKGAIKVKPIIFLVGFMGSGKSTIGPQLARKLRYTFIDLDRMIEANEKSVVSEIFARKGEAYFRELESRTLDEVCKTGGGLVVALGGGAVTDSRNRTTMKKFGTTVYLETRFENIFERVKRDSSRPMLLGPDSNRLDEPALKAKIRSLLSGRERFYLESDLRVNTADKTVIQCAKEIEARLRGM